MVYGEKFEEIFPYYLSLGMTYEQFWNGDPQLAVYYRKAEELRNEKKNQEMWMQGLYVYEAICNASPILRAFAKKGTKPHPYPTQPHPLKSEIKREEVKKEKAQMEKARDVMDAFAAKFNHQFMKKEGNADGKRSDD